MPKETNMSLEDYGIGQVTNTELQDALADYVRQQFDRALEHKRSIGIEKRMLRNLYSNELKYSPEAQALVEPGTDVFIGIGSLKARAAESWLIDINLNTMEKPWTMDSTPSPEIPEEDREIIIDRLMEELPNIASVEGLKARASALKELFTDKAKQASDSATKRMEVLIDDQMTEANWRTTFSSVISDLTVYPNAFVRAPFVVGKLVTVWRKNKLETRRASVPVARVINPFDAFPMPDATSTQNGSGFAERARYSRGDLYNLIKVDGFHAGNIRAVLDKHPNGFAMNLYGDAERASLEQTNESGEEPNGTLFDTIIYNGRIPGNFLADHGVLVADIQDTYEAEAWTVDGLTIKATLNPHPGGMRPIHSTSYRKVGGKFWGQSVIDLVYDLERVACAAARNLVKNMGYSSGPMGEVDAERVAETQDPTIIKPYRIALVGPDMTGTGGAAYKFHKVESVAAELRGVVEYHMKLADDFSGVPAYVLGNPQVAGAGRTLGGLSMLMGNAAKGIKNVQMHIDFDMIAPTVSGFYMYNLQTSEDASIKADAKVVAKGATGLLQKELAQTRTIELLQLMTPYIQQWDELPEGIKIMLREVLKSTGLPVDKIIPDPEAQEGALDMMRLLGQQSTANSLERGMSNPPELPSQSMPANAAEMGV